MRWAAEHSGSAPTIAATSYVRTENFFVNGQLDSGRRMLEQAADRLQPDTSVQAAAAYGCLHMRAAIVAARAGLPTHATQHLDEARGIATGVSEGVYCGTAFGPASVRIHEVACALDLDAPDRALAAAAGWQPPGQLPAERRSHLNIDIARAHLLTGDPDSALVALEQARRAAPEHTRLHPHVRHMLTAIRHTSDTPHVRRFAAAAGIPEST